MSVEWKRLDELVRFDRAAIDIESDVEYERLGIYSWGKGHFVREPVPGLDMGKMNYFTFDRPSLVFSNIQAWEGAVALVDDGPNAVCSSRFYPYVPRDGADVSLRYLFEFYRSAAGQAIMREKSSGTQVRNKLLSRSGIEAALVPVPPRPEQNRIADHLDSLADASGRLPSSGRALQAVQTGNLTPLHELVKHVVRSEPVEAERTYPLNGVKWYGQGLFERERKLGSELAAKTIRRIEAGDLVYNRLFAWKQSFAIADRPGWASNEFPTFEIDESRVRARVLLACLVGDEFTSAVNAASTGSTPTSRNRLKENEFLKLSVRIPAFDRQESIERVLKLADRAAAVEQRRNALAAALLPAARNEIFNAMR